MNPRAVLAQLARSLALVALTLSCQRLQPAAPTRPWPEVRREKWAASLHGYTPAMKESSVTKIGAAQGEFTDYVASIHNRLHPIFADWFLAALDLRPKTDPVNGERLSTSIEVVLDANGKILRLGVLKTSGVDEFDVGALESMWRASPFAKPPRETVSIDGRVYVHWELWREPYYACSTYFGKVFILRPARPSRVPSALQ